MASHAVTFEAVCELAEELSVDVSVTLRDGRHVITLVDHGRCRSLFIPVVRDFDAAVTALCCSLALVRDVPGCVGDAIAMAATWPELAALAHAPTST